MDIKYLVFESADYSGDALMELYQLPRDMCIVIQWNNTETYAELLKRYPADRHRFVWPSQSYKSQRNMYRAERELHGIEGDTGHYYRMS